MEGLTLEQVLETLDVGIVAQTAEAKVFFANEAASRLLGLSVDELLGRSSHDPTWAAHAIDGTPMTGHDHPAVRAARTGKPVRQVVFSVQRQGGKRVWLLVNSVPTVDDAGHVTQVVTSFADVTEQRRLEEMLRQRTEAALAERESLYRSVVASMSEGVVLHDEGGAIQDANASAEHVLGLSLEQMTGRTEMDQRWQLLEEDESPLDPETIPSRITMLTGKPVRGRILAVHRPNGERAWLSVNSEPVAGEGEHPKVVATFTDVTEARAAKLAVERSEARLRRVTNAVPGLVFELEVFPESVDSGRFTFLSQRTRDVLGVDHAPAPASCLWELVHPEDRPQLRRSLEQACAGPSRWDQEFRVKRRDETRWFHVLADAAGEGSVVMVRGILLDVTDRHQLEERLKQAQRVEAIGSLTAGVAHNFNNMLAAVLPNLELCLEDAPESIHQPLTDALAATRSAADLVKHLLLAVRKDPDQTLTPVNLTKVVEEVARMCRSTFDRRIDVVVTTPPEEVTVLGRKSQLHQVFLNLAINARDALAGRPSPRLELILSQNDAHDATVIVRDSGHGMSATTLGRLGEPFFTTKGPGLGTGLGLATVYGIVQEHGGTVAATSTVDVGTEFRVALPAASPRPPTAPRHAEGATPLTGRRLLLVDDEELVRRALTGQLVRRGIEVIAVESGPRALETLQQLEVDAVLLDLSMPEMPGGELLRRIAELQPGLPVVVMSGHVPDDVDLALASAIVTKPLRGATIATILEQVLTPRKAP